MPSEATVRYSDRAVYRRLLDLARPYWPHLAGILLLNLLATPLALLLPLPLRIAVDSVVGGRPVPWPLDRLLPAGVPRSGAAVLPLVVGLVIGIALLVQLQAVAGAFLRSYTGERLVLRFRELVFRHAQRLSLTYHDSKGTSHSIYRIQYGTPSIQYITMDGFIPMIVAAATLAGMIVVTARIDGQLALVALVISPVLFALTRGYKVRMRRPYEILMEEEKRALHVVQEVLTAVRVVKAFGREDDEQERFVHCSGVGARARTRIALAEGLLGFSINLTLAVGTAAVLGLGVGKVRSGAMTLGELLMVLAYVAQIYTPLHTLSATFGMLQKSLASARHAFELLDEDPDVDEREDARPLARADGAVEFRDVTFTYHGEHPVLHKISFRAKRGERIGIAGRTGAGKTTLMNLLTRFYDPSAGAILLDGQDLRDIELTDLRNQFALVLQEPVLFSTSIAENIKYARPDASDAEIEEAARAANAHDFITRLPEGYATEVGERGMRLSGGERQRISLARAFLKDAPILILDEPTSSVDVATEAAILEAMGRLMQGRTTFMIAHRLSTLDACDSVLVLEHGRLAAVTSGAAAVGAALEGGPHDPMSSSRMKSRRIVVLGTLASDPYAGMAWMHMQIAAGLRRLGHDVYYLEATSAWPYDPNRLTKVPDAEYALPYLKRVAEGFGLGERWAYRASYVDRHWQGPARSSAEELLAKADAVLNVAGATSLAEVGLSAGRLVYFGTDPVRDEIAYSKGEARDFIDAHDDVVTYGENIGQPDCPIPPLPRLRARTRQPVLLDVWEAGPPSRREFTTVGNWKQNGHDIEFQGQVYHWSKHHEFLKFLDLPRRVDVPIELAMGLSGMEKEDRHLLESHGWRLVNAHPFTTDPWPFRDYVKASRGEFTVAKDQNVRLRSGWFSERSANYLAAGRPVITQDTGFGVAVPTGEGLFAFTTMEEILAAFDAIASDYDKHSRAARAIAQEYFRAETVLAKVLEDLGL